MKAHEIMTRKVTVIGPDASVQRAARVMAGMRIGGLPVVTREGGIIGIISESDLLHRVELGTEGTSGRLTAYFENPDETARKFAKAHGSKVHEVMSRPVVSVHEDDELVAVADTFDRYGIKRVPVTRDGKLTGMITRSDLVRALSRLRGVSAEAGKSSGAVHEAIMTKLREQSWLDSSYLNLSVSDGEVRVSGYIASSEQREALRVLIEEVAGVRGIDDQLTVGMPELGWDGFH
jgi:CBS domain-containing protein